MQRGGWMVANVQPRATLSPTSSWVLASGGQSTGASALSSCLPMSVQGWFPLGLTGWISLQSKGLLSLLQYHSSKASVFLCSVFFMVQLSHTYMTTGKTIALTTWTFIRLFLLFNTLSRFVITVLPRSKRLLISRLQSLSVVILEPKKIKCIIASTFSHSICHEVMEPNEAKKAWS